MVVLAALRSARPELLDQAAAAWSRIGAGFGNQVRALRIDVAQPLFDGTTWTGAAADAASTSLSGLSSQLGTTEEDSSTMASLLRDAAAGIRDAQSMLRAAEDVAARSRLTIGPDGSVSASPPPLLGPRQPLLGAAPSPAAGEVADLVRRALAVAREVDAQITARLKMLQAFPATASKELLDAGQLAGVFDDSMIPAEGTNPANVNAWWKALSASQQHRLMHEFPGQIGWLDGLPATARDEANRIALAAAKQQLQGQLAGVDAREPPATVTGGGRFGTEQMPNPAWQQWHAQVMAIEGKLAGIDAVDSSLALGGKNGYPETYLLGFDTSGNGHAIVSFGEPDSAANVVTYVPGLGSKITGALGDSSRAAVLWRQAHRFDPTAQTASIYWLNYNAPQLSLSSLLSPQSVALPDDAQAAAPTLDRFAAGLAAAHTGSPAHTVMLGHSYGSLVVGEAASRAPGHLANDLAFVGSPGVSVNHAAQLGVPAAHVYAGEASNDPVAHLGQFGTDPASVSFGGRTFGVAAGSLWPPLSAHSQYWDPGSPSLLNLGHLVDGQYGRVTPGQIVLEDRVPGMPPGFPWIGPVHI